MELIRDVERFSRLHGREPVQKVLIALNTLLAISKAYSSEMKSKGVEQSGYDE